MRNIAHLWTDEFDPHVEPVEFGCCGNWWTGNTLDSLVTNLTVLSTHDGLELEITTQSAESSQSHLWRAVGVYIDDIGGELAALFEHLHYAGWSCRCSVG